MLITVFDFFTTDPVDEFCSQNVKLCIHAFTTVYYYLKNICDDKELHTDRYHHA